MMSSMIPYPSMNPTLPGLKPLLISNAALTGAPPTDVGLSADAMSAVTTTLNASAKLIFSFKKEDHITTLVA